MCVLKFIVLPVTLEKQVVDLNVLEANNIHSKLCNLIFEEDRN